MSRQESSFQIIPNKHLSFTKPVGRGGFGIVYMGMWRHTVVAIKSLINSAMIESFEKECGAWGELNHPQIIHLYGVSLNPCSMIMDYKPKGSLANLLGNVNKDWDSDWSIRQQLAVDIGDALVYVHTMKGMMHRDIKTDNILVGKQDGALRAFLSDFGLTKQIPVPSISDEYYGCGTISWLAPEILQGKPNSQESDVYAYGLFLYALASLIVDPFFDKLVSMGSIGKFAEYLQSVDMKKALPMSISTPVRIRQLVYSCTEKSPPNRPKIKKLMVDLTGMDIYLSQDKDGQVKEEDEKQDEYYEEQPKINNASNLFTVPIKKESELYADPKELETFFSHIARGKRNKVEEMLKKQPTLMFVKGTFDDISELRCIEKGDEFTRIFTNISGWQYALWAFDNHMLQTMIRCIGNNQKLIDFALEQYNEVSSGKPKWVKQYGRTFNLKVLSQGLKSCSCDNKGWSYKECIEHWKRVVMSEQRRLPAHVIQEYCRKNRPFRPCPTFLESELPQSSYVKFGVDGWFENKSKHRGWIRVIYNPKPVLVTVYTALNGTIGKYGLPWCDGKALEQLKIIRMQQIEQIPELLKASLKGGPSL